MYTLKFLLSHPNPPTKVDIVDSSPVPFGLIRTGVAPDHGEVKNVLNDFTQVFESAPTVAPGTEVRFIGGVKVGPKSSVSLSDLETHYDAIVLCHGAGLSNELELPAYKPDGSSVPCPPVLRVRDAVEWYNAASWADEPGFRVARERIGGTDPLNITVIGGGNVSLDLARVVAKGGVGSLADSEVRDAEIEEMEDWKVGGIGLYNRRGVYQTAFTTKEFRDIYKMAKAGKARLRVDEEDVERSENKESLEELEGSRPMSRLVKLIKQVAEDKEVKDGKGTEIAVRYLRSPKEIYTDESGNIVSVRFELQALAGGKGWQRAVGTGEFEDVKTDVLVSSMGYKASPVDYRLPFDGGRYDHIRGHVEGKVFAAGWCKRGPKGIVGTNIVDAKETVGMLYESTEGVGSEGDFVDFLDEKGIEYCSWEDWKRVDEVEMDEGRRREGQGRSKIKEEQDIWRVAKGWEV